MNGVCGKGARVRTFAFSGQAPHNAGEHTMSAIDRLLFPKTLTEAMFSQRRRQNCFYGDMQKD